MRRSFIVLVAVLSSLLALATTELAIAAGEPNEELLQMIVGLVSDKDRDMRTVGLQQVREEAKGTAATKRFAALLPKLPPESQAGLLDALGERGDKTARPAVLEMLTSKDEAVRAAAIKALGPLGEAADVPVLTQRLAKEGPEKAAAQASLARVSGEDVNTAIVAQLKPAKPDVRATLLGVLAARNAKSSVAVVLEAAQDSDAEVRAAALGALRVLAEQEQVGAIVKLLKAAQEDQEQWKAEQALLAVCTRGREACVGAILAGLADASPAASTSLLRALARSGGDKALAAIVAATKDPRAPVASEAVRQLSNWPDAAAAPYLREIAENAKSLSHHVVAVQGLIRLGSPVKGRPADLTLLGDAMKLARRPDEKRRVLGVLQGVATPESLALVLLALDDPVLADDAGRAVLSITDALTGPAQAQRRPALDKVRDKAKDPLVREKAQKAIDAL